MNDKIKFEKKKIFQKKIYYKKNIFRPLKKQRYLKDFYYDCQVTTDEKEKQNINFKNLIEIFKRSILIINNKPYLCIEMDEEAKEIRIIRQKHTIQFSKPIKRYKYINSYYSFQSFMKYFVDIQTQGSFNEKNELHKLFLENFPKEICKFVLSEKHFIKCVNEIEEPKKIGEYYYLPLYTVPETKKITK